MTYQARLDLRALEYRLNQEDDAIDAADARVTALEEGIRLAYTALAGRGFGGATCDQTVTVKVKGCAGLGVLGAIVASISPVTGATLASASTNGSGNATLCGRLSDGYVIVHVVAAGFAPQAVTIALPQSGAPLNISLVARGGYSQPPIVIVDDPPAGGVTALVYARITAGNIVQDYVVVDGGSGYTATPGVTVEPDFFGHAATARAIPCRLDSIAVTNGGSGYGSPTVTITPAGTNATATLTFDANGQATGYSITGAGTGYAYAPAITFSIVGGSVPNCRLPSAFCTVAAGVLTAITITDPGANLAVLGAAFRVTITGGHGVNATATAVVAGGVVTAIVMTNKGAGYLLAPTIAIVGGGGASATATATVRTDVVGAVVGSFNGLTYNCISTCGPVPINGTLTGPQGETGRLFSTGALTGLFVAPVIDVLFTLESGTVWLNQNGTTGMSSATEEYLIHYGLRTAGNAAAFSTISGGHLTTITVTDGGFNYSVAPTVTFPPPSSGITALAHAVLTADVVTSIVIDNAGSGYITGIGGNGPVPVIGGTPSPEQELSVGAFQLNQGGTHHPVFVETSGSAMTAAKRPSSITCSPYQATYDFAGTAVDGIVFQSGTVVTIDGS